jgi:hypothetical protein
MCENENAYISVFDSRKLNTMAADFSMFKRFYEKERVEALTDILKTNHIEYEVIEDSETLDSLYGDKHFSKQYVVKIHPDDFKSANEILLKLGEKELDTVDNDHYLYSFTDQELIGIISKPDEWNEFDFQLAKKILKERGKEINDETIDLLKNQRIVDLAKPDEGQKTWIYAGYFFSLLGIFFIIGGFISFFIGWHLSTYKKTLPNGQQIYGYKSEDRKHGRWIWITGGIAIVTTLTIRFLNNVNL